MNFGSKTYSPRCFSKSFFSLRNYLICKFLKCSEIENCEDAKQRGIIKISKDGKYA